MKLNIFICLLAICISFGEMFIQALNNAHFYYFILFLKIFYLFIFRGRGREDEREERNIELREKHQLVASHMEPD